jgi:two-component system, NtrC family, response regulator PilR
MKPSGSQTKGESGVEPTYAAAAMLGVRLSFLASALLAASLSDLFFQHEVETILPFAYDCLVVLFAISGGSALYLRSRASGRWYETSHIILDVTAISLAVFCTGGPVSAFHFLYLLLITSNSLLSTRGVAIFSALASSVGYGFLLLAMYQKWLPVLYEIPPRAFHFGRLSLQVAGLSCAGLLTAYVASRFSERLRISNSLAKESQKSLSELGFLFEQDKARLRDAEDLLKMQDRMARLLADEKKISLSSVQDPHFVGESPVLQKVINLIERVAHSEANVLIIGESGTGKELVARGIHKKSGRSDRPFVPVNCGAIPENLIESELFGHKKGAYTGAHADSIGLFRQAEGGTLFLDEIGELPLHLQAKLLRAIQEKAVRPVGGERDIPVDARIVAATNKDLKREATLGNFREDLYFRLNVITIPLPPLRDRREDIPLLVNTFLRRLLPEEKVPIIPPATLRHLMGYEYPGNVRELENVIERAVVLGGEVILPEHLPEYVRAKADFHNHDKKETRIIVDESIHFPINLDELLATVEKKYLLLALEESHGIRKKAAELLGINFRSFRYRLQKFGISDKD